MRTLFEAGGKRLRPALVFLTGRLTGADYGRMAPAARAVELIHASTLVHDDVIDHSPTRRGVRTIAVGEGEGPAIVVGDFYFARAYGEAARSGVAEVVALLAAAVMNVCEGELRQQDELHRYQPGLYRYFRRIRLKTASLLEAACEAGALLAGLAGAERQALRLYGLYTGLAFQVADDLLDYMGQEQEVGKPVGHDLLEGSATLPLILARADPAVAGRLATLLPEKTALDLAAVAEDGPGSRPRTRPPAGRAGAGRPRAGSLRAGQGRARRTHNEFGRPQDLTVPGYSGVSVHRHLLSLSLGQDAAPLAVREQVSLDREQTRSLLERLRRDPDIGGGLVLSTCGRVEVHVTGVHPRRMRAAVERELGAAAPLFKARHGLESARHLFRVGTGLESPLLGESQILGQLRAAARLARDQGVLDALLGGTVDRAVAAARRARRESGLGHGAATLGQAAVAQVRARFGRVEGVRVLVVGAGEVGTLAARALARAGAELVIASRSSASAVAAARRARAEALDLAAVPAALAEVDAAIFAAAAAAPVLQAATLRGRARPLLLLDLAVPRNVEPAAGQLPGVHLVNIDEVTAAVATGTSRRQSAAARAAEVLEQELAGWSAWVQGAAAAPTLAAIAAYADGIREREVRRTLRALGDPEPDVRRRVEALSRALVSRLMLHPISYVRAHPDDQLAGELLQRLFSEPPGRSG
jgi:glutamyl-tRNA reductase